jgi:hypothetical protein
MHNGETSYAQWRSTAKYNSSLYLAEAFEYYTVLSVETVDNDIMIAIKSILAGRKQEDEIQSE